MRSLNIFEDTINSQFSDIIFFKYFGEDSRKDIGGTERQRKWWNFSDISVRVGGGSLPERLFVTVEIS